MHQFFHKYNASEERSPNESFNFLQLLGLPYQLTQPDRVASPSIAILSKYKYFFFKKKKPPSTERFEKGPTRITTNQEFHHIRSFMYKVIWFKPPPCSNKFFCLPSFLLGSYECANFLFTCMTQCWYNHIFNVYKSIPKVVLTSNNN